MVQVIGIPANVKTFANLFLALKDTDWVKVQRKLGTINVRKINNSFQFIDDLLSLNEGSTFEKHFKDIYPAEFHSRLFHKRDNFGFNVVRMQFYCSNIPSKSNVKTKWTN